MKCFIVVKEIHYWNKETATQVVHLSGLVLLKQNIDTAKTMFMLRSTTYWKRNH